MKRATRNKRCGTQIIVALDVDNFKKAKKLVDLLYPKVKIFKVGLVLFLVAGEDIIRYIKRKGASVFLDFKFYDIPNTVALVSKEMIRLGVDMFTVHSQGGLSMLSAAKEAVQQEAKYLKRKPPLILGVTVLTSKDGKGNIKQRVLNLARQAKKAGLDGVVCAVQEVKKIREHLGKDFIVVTPGIRLDKQRNDDQRRIATPKEAKEAGSDYLVIGRPVTKAKYPLKVIKKILADIV